MHGLFMHLLKNTWLWEVFFERCATHNKRVIQWDNTDINLPKPTEKNLLRLVYSYYHGGNVGKGVFLQICGCNELHLDLLLLTCH